MIVRLSAWLIFFLASRLAAAATAPPLIFVDPGHGAAEVGVKLEAQNEAEIVFDIATQFAAQLKSAGFESMLSRTALFNPPPSARAAMANGSGARAFLSLHLNHSPSPSVRGPRIFIPKPLPGAAKDEPRRWEQAGGQRSDEAKGLGLELAKTLGQSEAAKLSVQTLNLVAFKGLSIPGVVVELGFLSHAESRERFSDPAFRKVVAGRLAGAVASWAQSLSSSAGALP